MAANQNPHFHISTSTTLREVIAMLGTVSKFPKTPTVKSLCESSEIIAESDSCILFSNGYAVYSNETGRTVMFAADCSSYTYRFDPLNDSERSYQKQEETVDDLNDYPWVLAVTIRGDHQIENNSLNRAGSRCSSNVSDEETDEETEFSYKGAYRFPNPEDSYIRKEMQEERLGRLSERQRRFYILNHIYGYTQEEIAAFYQISPNTVGVLLMRAGNKMKRKK